MDSSPIYSRFQPITLYFMPNNVVRIYDHYVKRPNNQYEIENHEQLEFRFQRFKPFDKV